MSKKLRPAGDITGDVEPLIHELAIGHGLQKGEILALFNAMIDIHFPDSIELYEKGGSPEFYYGPRRD